ncbi:hypothetical protein Gekk315_00093 [Aeromonas phage Gekk3-15]
MTKQIVIVGAGMAGLLAAIKFPDAKVIEGSPAHVGRKQQHKALLRFRNDSVSRLTGIPFKKVNVHKAIVAPHTERDAMPMLLTECNLQLANLYSSKVTGSLGGRSIWNLSASERYIAPDDFFDRLISRVERDGRAIEFDSPLGYLNPNNIYINTAPMQVMAGIAGFDLPVLPESFKANPIHVDTYQIPNCDVYQTLYFPNPQYGVYRASITGDKLIVERISSDEWVDQLAIHHIMNAFGLPYNSANPVYIETNTQSFGKIVPLSKPERDAVLYRLTREYDVYSLGRFATWRNILLDDVAKDVEVIHKLISASEYQRSMFVNVPM